MNENEKTEYLKGMFSGATFQDSVVVGIAEQGSTVCYHNGAKEEKAKTAQGNKQDILEYVNRLIPLVKEQYATAYIGIWEKLLDIDEVRSRIYDKGKQQQTCFNRNLVAQIIHQASSVLYLPSANPTVMTEYLEPGSGKAHSVRQKLGEMPDKTVKKAIEAYLNEII